MANGKIREKANQLSKRAKKKVAEVTDRLKRLPDEALGAALEKALEEVHGNLDDLVKVSIDEAAETPSVELDALQRAGNSRIEQHQNLIDQMAEITRLLNEDIDWLRSEVLEPLGKFQITPDVGMQRIGVRLPSWQRFQDRVKTDVAGCITLRCVMGAAAAGAVEIQPVLPPGYVIGALRHEDEYKAGLCWAGTLQLVAGVEAYLGIELAVWFCEPAELTGRFKIPNELMLSKAGWGGKVAYYVREREGKNLEGLAVTPLYGAGLKVTGLGSLGGGAILAWLPGKTLDRITR